MKKNDSDLLLWLQNWYRQYCDGDWEHDESINIHTIDNPGWRVTINLESTHCKNNSFDNIEMEIDENNWYHCFIRNGKFEGACSPSNLSQILQVFHDWAERCQD